MTDILLSDEELQRLTGYQQQALRENALKTMRVPYRVNPRGHLLVARQAAERWLGVDVPAPKTEEPDFSGFV